MIVCGFDVDIGYRFDRYNDYGIDAGDWEIRIA